jgi:predicted O-methyltransferase YrrM
MSDVQLTAYNVKTKEKGVPIMDAVITKTAKGAYMAQGHDGKGNKLTTLCNEAKAMAAIEAGTAKKGWE